MLCASPTRFQLALKAFQLEQSSLLCRRCMHKTVQAQNVHRSFRQTPFLRAFKQPHLRIPRRAASDSQVKTRTSPPRRAAPDSPVQTRASPLGILSQSIGQKVPEAASFGKASYWPPRSHRSVAYWLLGSAASVFGIVIFGGLTRLTESGLSITEWRPVTGSFPPRDQCVWEEEFARYKLSPEFKMLNSRMSLDEFKQIYWMEWTHRLWGRVVGLTMVIPTIYFIARRRVTKAMALRITGICGLIGFQGFLGWWMVKSGLKDDLFAPGSHPRVSQYRLAAHLGTAFVVYLAMVWNGLSILQEYSLLANPAKTARQLADLLRPEMRSLIRWHRALFGLIFLTAMSGALVAGLDAGLIYNDFPWMGQGFLPPKREMFDTFYSHTPDPHPDLWWRNMLENPVLVQLDHRVLATTTYCAVTALYAWTLFSPKLRTSAFSVVGRTPLVLLGLVNMQVALGITTLWYLVPTPLAAMHQAGALLLLTGAVVMGSKLRIHRRTLQLLQRTQSPAKIAQRGPEAMLAARLRQ